MFSSLELLQDANARSVHKPSARSSLELAHETHTHIHIGRDPFVRLSTRARAQCAVPLSHLSPLSFSARSLRASINASCRGDGVGIGRFVVVPELWPINYAREYNGSSVWRGRADERQRGTARGREREGKVAAKEGGGTKEEEGKTVRSRRLSRAANEYLINLLARGCT